MQQNHTMKTSLIYIILSTLYCSLTSMTPQTAPTPWLIVGAGPAGIGVIGILLECGVAPEDIIWLDPEFNVGRMGKYYMNVPGNARVKAYINFLTACSAFTECKSNAIEKLLHMSSDMTPELKYIIEPLMDITTYLRTKIASIQDEMISLDFHDNLWHVGTKTTLLQAQHVVLATGAHPREVHYNNIQQIPLDLALDKNALAAHISPHDIVGVIGSAHSALLIVKYLTELPVSHVINFYKHPIVYPTPVSGGIAWSENGLKGELALWTQTVLAHNPPANLLRILNTEETLQKWLPTCTKLIVAVGYERNYLPPINGDTQIYATYDTASGTIGHNLFGVGIAFPEKKQDALGNIEFAVGLSEFMHYIQKIVPEWLNKNVHKLLYHFDNLFDIAIL